MLRYVQGVPQDQEEDLDDQPSTSSSSTHHQPPISADSATAPSPDQQPSTTSSGTIQPSPQPPLLAVSPVTERPSASDIVETYVPPPTDPALWPAHILDADRVEIVHRGPFKVSPDFSFPKGPDGRAFHSSLQFKTLPNGEKVDRSWVVYSPQNNAVMLCMQSF